MQINQRDINIVMKIIGKNTIIAEATMLDIDHSMRVEFTIDIPSRKIIDATAEMLKVPFKRCFNTVVRLRDIVGLKIERGIVKRISKIVGGADGCMHLLEVTVSAVRLASQTLIWKDYDLIAKEKFFRLSEKERIKRTIEFMKDTCLVYKTNKK